MGETALIYHSEHHGNTKKLLGAIADIYSIDLFSVPTTRKIDLTKYETIGFASGIFMGKLHESLFQFVESCPEIYLHKKAFVVFTSGAINEKYVESFETLLTKKGFNVVGTFNCLGYDTYGPFKIIGGIAKGHPDEKDKKSFLSFYEKTVLSQK